MNPLSQGTLRQYTQWLWIEHPTFQLGGGHLITELLTLPGFKSLWLGFRIRAYSQGLVIQCLALRFSLQFT